MPVPKVEFTDTRLPNGLRLLISEDHLAPVSAVNVWYNVGSKHEEPGKTGFAHLFEHVMFQGSAHVGKAEHIALIQAAGGTMNGTTWLERTNYFETMPSHQLELALWLEADRMGTLLDALSQENLDNQREVVKNEKRWSYDNRPYGSWVEKMLNSLFPAGHPYHHPTIGSMEDLDAASLDDVQSFFKLHYAPNNAVLSVVGDVDPEQVRGWVEKYFGAIPRNPNLPAPLPDMSLPPKLGSEIRLVIPDRVPLPRIHWGFRGPVFGDPRLDALDLAGQILAGGKGSRLHRRLVREERLAQDVALFSMGLVAGGSITAGWATARPGVDLIRLETAFWEELERLGREAPSDDELARAKALTEADELGALQRVEEKADRLSMYATLFDDPEMINRILPRYLSTTAEQIRSVAAEVFTPDNRALITFLPAAGLGRDAERRVSGASGASVVADRPRHGEPRPFRFPAFERDELSNGLGLIAVHLPGRALVTASLVLPAGAVDEPPEQGGVTSLMARALTEGTAHRDAIELTEAAERLGASLHAEAGWDGLSISVEVPAERLSDALALAAEVAMEPAFPAAEVDRLREERLNDLLQAKADPRRRADDGFVETIYARGSAYGRPSAGTEETVPGLDAEAVRAIHRRRLDPTRMTLIIGGDLEAVGSDVRSIAESRFGGWAGNPAAEGPTKPRVAPASRERHVRVIHRPGSVQTEIRVGHVGLPRLVPDFHAISVMSAILGGLFNSRLNRKLREEKGYTYGAGAGFDMRRGAGPFAARAAVNTDVTLPALQEIFVELDGIREGPPSRDEIHAARDFLVGVFPLRFETPPAVVGAIAGLLIHGLPMDELDRYRPAIEAVTDADVHAAARDHIRPDEAAVVLVGDADAILPPLEGANIGPITVDREELPRPEDAGDAA